MIKNTLEETIADCNFRIEYIEKMIEPIKKCEEVLPDMVTFIQASHIQSLEKEVTKLKRLRDWLLELQQLREVVKIIKEDREEF